MTLFTLFFHSIQNTANNLSYGQTVLPLLVGYPTEDVVYRWARLKVVHNMQLSQFSLGRIRLADRNVTASCRLFAGEQSSVLVAELELIRQQGYFILQLYLPCSMLVVVSWVSFWIHKEAAIARVSLGKLKNWKE